MARSLILWRICLPLLVSLLLFLLFLFVWNLLTLYLKYFYHNLLLLMYAWIVRQYYTQNHLKVTEWFLVNFGSTSAYIWVCSKSEFYWSLFDITLCTYSKPQNWFLQIRCFRMNELMKSIFFIVSLHHYRKHKGRADKSERSASCSTPNSFLSNYFVNEIKAKVKQERQWLCMRN